MQPATYRKKPPRAMSARGWRQQPCLAAPHGKPHDARYDEPHDREPDAPGNMPPDGCSRTALKPSRTCFCNPVHLKKDGLYASFSCGILRPFCMDARACRGLSACLPKARKKPCFLFEPPIWGKAFFCHNRSCLVATPSLTYFPLRFLPAAFLTCAKSRKNPHNTSRRMAHALYTVTQG